MNILFVRRNVVVWDSKDNEKLHNKTVFEDYDNDSRTIVDFDLIHQIPQIGQKIVINGIMTKVVDSVLFIDGTQFDEKLLENYKAIVEYQPNILRINFNLYMKAFTHCYDRWKEINDPTNAIYHKFNGKDYDPDDYKFIPPETYDQWYEDKKILDQYLRYPEELRKEFAMKRCAFIEEEK